MLLHSKRGDGLCQRNGNADKSLQAPNGVYLYAAVDEQDRVYVASVDRKKGNVVIRLYDLDGLNMKERVEFNVLKLTLGTIVLFGVTWFPSHQTCSRLLVTRSCILSKYHGNPSHTLYTSLLELYSNMWPICHITCILFIL